jgi:hypothetical protein
LKFQIVNAVELGGDGPRAKAIDKANVTSMEKEKTKKLAPMRTRSLPRKFGTINPERRFQHIHKAPLQLCMKKTKL